MARPQLYLDSGAAPTPLDEDSRLVDGFHHTRSMLHALAKFVSTPVKGREVGIERDALAAKEDDLPLDGQRGKSGRASHRTRRAYDEHGTPVTRHLRFLAASTTTLGSRASRRASSSRASWATTSKRPARAAASRARASAASTASPFGPIGGPAVLASTGYRALSDAAGGAQSSEIAE